MSSQPGVRTYTTEDYIAQANELTDLMGADWLAAHSARPHRDTHAIALWLEQYRNTPPEGLSRSQQLLQIGELMFNIQALRDAGTQNLETRIDDLRLDDPDRVSSAIHEIRVAAEYVQSGRRVLFIPEASVQTPDLLIDDCLEVECKHKSRASQQDKNRFELYRILSRKLRAAFPERVTHSALLLDAIFHIEPRREFIDRIVATAREGLGRPQPSQFSETSDSLFTANFRILPAGSGPTALALPRGDTEFDLRSTEAIAVDQNGTLGRFINLNVGCEVRQDRVKSIIRSIKSAASQFSGRYPAIVSVDISAITASGRGESLAYLHEGILAALNSRTTISRVELSTTHFIEEGEGQAYCTSIEVIDNPKARLPIGGS
ncbi:hypothetical protein BFN03_03950 [Rhodococcus sp. WMMA185]|uniref:hypothetical protein n=1 Tax=Rhodococcus sp. WMMA185 TaxID=679318 RepID=UPI0008784267|nr:hypothetical protein [Rhodococcus sp. WMMA185]AOW92141.1 hypothetical protein BFN03_03950 [Rhodococcus sp. WMMA185]